MGGNFRYKYNMICIQNIEKYRNYTDKQIIKNYIFHINVYEKTKKKLFYNKIECENYNCKCKCINCRLLSDYLKESYKDKKIVTIIEKIPPYKYNLNDISIKSIKDNIKLDKCFFCSNKDFCINIDNYYGICNKCFIFL